MNERRKGDEVRVKIDDINRGKREVLNKVKKCIDMKNYKITPNNNNEK